MINLIPSNAKKSIALEYWLRVCTSWFILWSGTLIIGACILIPAYALITIQVGVYESSAKIAQESVESYDQVSQNLKTASEQAKLIVDSTSEPKIYMYIGLFERLQAPGIILTKIILSREEEGLSPVILDGTAIDRESLARFRDRLLTEPSINSVDLPIANLAKDKDIQFTLSVIMDNTVSI